MSTKYQFVINAKDDTDKAFKSIEGHIESVEKATRIGTAAVAGFTAAFAALSIAENRSRELENFARIANTTSEEFYDMARAAKTVGIEEDKLADISKDTLEKLGEFIATGGGGFKDFFEQVAPKVNLTAKELQELSGPDVLIAVKRAMDDANVSMEQQSFYLESIASDTTNLIPLLEEEGKAFKELSPEAVTVTDAIGHFGEVALKVINDLDDKTQTSSSFANWLEGVSAQLEAARTGDNTIRSLEADLAALKKTQQNFRLKGFNTDSIDKQIADKRAEIAFLKSEVSKTEILQGIDFSGENAVTNIEQVTTKVKELNGEVNNLKSETVSAENTFSLFGNEDSIQHQLESVRTSFLSAEQLQLDSALNRQEIIENAWLSGIATDEEYQQLSADNWDNYHSVLEQMAVANKVAMLSNSSELFGSLADLSKAFSGEQSGIYKAMFAVSKGFAIAESIIKIQQGIASAAALPFPTNIPAMATVAAQTAGVVSTIQGTDFQGARRNGGYTEANRRYLINEDGLESFISPLGGKVLTANETKNISNRSSQNITINLPGVKTEEDYSRIRNKMHRDIQKALARPN